MLEFLLNNNLISKHQHGFISGRSTCTQLLETLEDWSIELQHGESLDAVYIDFSKAFDSVVHSKLLAKLEGHGIRYELLGWIAEFLRDRKQCVIIGSGVSEITMVHSGVVQGSVLGSLLFLLFVNDVCDLFQPPVKIKLFADDIKLYSSIKTRNDADILSNYIDALEKWATLWQLSINEKKSSVLHMGNKNPNFVFKMTGTTLSAPDIAKDLGIIVNKKLTFENYIESIVVKARRRMGVFFRAFLCRELKFMKLAYVTYIRPILEYNTQIWSPSILKHINKIEAVQRNFTKRIPSIKHLPYHDRLVMIDLETLEIRRIKNDMTMYFKIIRGLNCLTSDDFFVFSPKIYASRGNDFKISKPNIKKNKYQNLFSCRGINCWNALPNDIVNAPTLSIFKNKLNKIELGKYLHGRA